MVESNAHTYLYAHLARPTAVSDAHDRPTPASQLVSQHGHVASAAGHRAMTAGAKHGSPLASQHRPSRSAHAGLEASPSALSVHTCSVAHGCPQASSRGGRWRSASVSPIAVLLVLGAMVPSVRAQEATPHDGKFVAFACLIPLLVGLCVCAIYAASAERYRSGLLAGLTLGYVCTHRKGSWLTHIDVARPDRPRGSRQDRHTQAARPGRGHTPAPAQWSSPPRLIAVRCDGGHVARTDQPPACAFAGGSPCVQLLSSYLRSPQSPTALR